MCGNGLRCVGYLLYLIYKKNSFIVYIGKNKYLLRIDNQENVIVKIDSINHKDELIELGNLHYVCKDNRLSSFHKKIVKAKKCNVHLIKVINKDQFKIKSYEYGVGKTCCCGSGIIASFYYLKEKQEINDYAEVLCEGGKCYCFYENGIYYLKGKVNFICKGEYYGI